MNPEALLELLKQVEGGQIKADDAARQFAGLPFDDLGYAKVDLHRAHRHGRPEVIFCNNKTPQQVTGIIGSLKQGGQSVLATHATPEIWEVVRKDHPELHYFEAPRLIGPAELAEEDQGEGSVLIVTAGTADLPVAEEALLTARACGSRTKLVADVGVAGIHRLLAQTSHLQNARAIVVAAGMEGALPSVVGGLVRAPVIAVPTSVGYGASFGGIAAMLGMLNSCSSNVTVVNIDNGFGAGYVASLINRLPPLGDDHA